MAIAVIGGLIMSTLLSLVFVPAVFTVLDDLGRFPWRLFSRFVGDAGRIGGAERAPGRPQPTIRPRPASEISVAAEFRACRFFLFRMCDGRSLRARPLPLEHDHCCKQI